MQDTDYQLDPDQVTAHFLDNAPVIFLGCTAGELGSILVFSFLFWFAAFCTLFMSIGVTFDISLWAMFFSAIPATLPTTAFTVWVVAKRVAVMKRDKPDGYYDLKLKLFWQGWMARFGMPTEICRYCGIWDIDRNV